jgi:hypothetical protein
VKLKYKSVFNFMSLKHLTVIFGQVVTKGNISLFSGELDSGHCASVLPDE